MVRLLRFGWVTSQVCALLHLKRNIRNGGSPVGSRARPRSRGLPVPVEPAVEGIGAPPRRAPASPADRCESVLSLFSVLERDPAEHAARSVARGIALGSGQGFGSWVISSTATIARFPRLH